MDLTVKLTSNATLPMEILHHIFSYTSNVVFRPFTDDRTDETKWRMWLICKFPNTDPRYRKICAIPPRLKLYHSSTIHNNHPHNRVSLNLWYYSVIFPHVTSNKRFKIMCMQESMMNAINTQYIIWSCFEKLPDNNDETDETPQQYKRTDIRLHVL